MGIPFTVNNKSSDWVIEVFYVEFFDASNRRLGDQEVARNLNPGQSSGGTLGFPTNTCAYVIQSLGQRRTSGGNSVNTSARYNFNPTWTSVVWNYGARSPSPEATKALNTSEVAPYMEIDGTV